MDRGDALYVIQPTFNSVLPMPSRKKPNSESQPESQPESNPKSLLITRRLPAPPVVIVDRNIPFNGKIAGPAASIWKGSITGKGTNGSLMEDPRSKKLTVIQPAQFVRIYDPAHYTEPGNISDFQIEEYPGLLNHPDYIMPDALIAEALFAKGSLFEWLHRYLKVSSLLIPGTLFKVYSFQSLLELCVEDGRGNVESRMHNLTSINRYRWLGILPVPMEIGAWYRSWIPKRYREEFADIKFGA